MKVYDNIAFGLKMNKVDKGETEPPCARAAELLHTRTRSTAIRPR